MLIDGEDYGNERVSLEINEVITLCHPNHPDWTITIRKDTSGKYQILIKTHKYYGDTWEDLPQSVESIETQIAYYTKNK